MTSSLDKSAIGKGMIFAWTGSCVRPIIDVTEDTYIVDSTDRSGVTQTYAVPKSLVELHEREIPHNLSRFYTWYGKSEQYTQTTCLTVHIQRLPYDYYDC